MATPAPNNRGLVYAPDGRSVTHRECRGYGDTPPHVLEFTPENFSPWAMNIDRAKVMCRNCDREYRKDHKGAGAKARKAKQSLAGARAAFAASAPSVVIPPANTTADDPEAAPDDAEVEPAGPAGSHDYVLSPHLAVLWRTIVNNTLQRGLPPRNLIFFGPSGSGKTEGARHLADLVGLPFTKVDAASMTDPEAWFGTREVVVEAGVPVTKYIPSAFIQSLQQPGVTFIDEMNRVDDEHRNVILPLTDGTGAVTNPLTGEVITRHRHNFIIMAGNRGLQFTGTSAVDPAFTTRALTEEFGYVDEQDEVRIVSQATGCDEATARILAKFAADSRAKALIEPDFQPISTREVIAAAELASGDNPMDRDLAVKYAIINAASPEGGSASVRTELEGIWAGVRVLPIDQLVPEDGEEEEHDANLPGTTPATNTAGYSGWQCPVHNQVKVVPAGVSGPNAKYPGRPYNAFKACPVYGCDETESRSGKNHGAVKVQPRSGAGATCDQCGQVNPPGRNVICTNCGASLK